MLAETSGKLFIPEKQGCIFVSPELSQWSSLMVSNRQIAQKIPDRMIVRRELLEIAGDYTLKVTGTACINDAFENVIAAGHQAVWHHCGIWVKSLAVSKFVKIVNGRGLHIVLDHDIRDTAMLLPERNVNDSWSFQKIQIESEHRPIPLELRPLPQKEGIRIFLDAVIKAYPWQFCNNIWSQPSIITDEKISNLRSVADLITYLQWILNVNLGLDNILYLPVSLLSESDSFLDFVVSLSLNAHDFADSYNNGIDNALKLSKSKTRIYIRRLIRDCEGDFIEMPFWLIMPDGNRTSLYVQPDKGGTIRIGAGSAIIGCLDSRSRAGKTSQLISLLRQAGLKLRPKAVSLTLFVRLFLTDWFVHGIGGSAYEMVTDYIIRDFFKVESPEFGIATCTMTLPLLPGVAAPDDGILQLRHRLHVLKHHPEQYINELTLKKHRVTSLIQLKQKQIEQANDRSLPHSIRQSAWSSLGRTNKKLLEYTKNAVGILENKIEESGENKISRDVCNCREYFFGLFPKEKLDEIAKSFTFAGSEDF